MEREKKKFLVYQQNLSDVWCFIAVRWKKQNPEARAAWSIYQAFTECRGRVRQAAGEYWRSPAATATPVDTGSGGVSVRMNI